MLTVLHVSWYRFGRIHHPAIWRMIVGLSQHVRTVVLAGEYPGYFAESDPHDGQHAAVTDVAVHSHGDMHSLRDPHVVGPLAQTLQRKYGAIDVVIGHYKSSALAIHLAEKLGVPTLASFQGDDANLALHSAEYGADYRKLRAAPFSHALGVSRNIVERLLAFGMPAERTFVHHRGIDLSSYPLVDRKHRDAPLRIVMAAQFRPSKGHALAIRAFARLWRELPNASLHFFGDGRTPEQCAHAEQMRTMVAGAGLSGAVHFHGAVAVTELARELAAADILLQPSGLIDGVGQIEGVPNTILEGMAAGLPVVATRHGGIPEAVRHEQTGLLVDEYDEQGLARALLRLATDRDLRLQYGAAGRAYIEREFCSVGQSEILAARIRAMSARHRA